MMIVIQNQTLSVSYDETSGTFTLSSLNDLPLTVTGTIAGAAGTATRKAVTDTRFGGGQSITVNGDDGTEATILVYARLPFALLRRTLKNGGANPQVLNRVPLATFHIEGGAPLTTLGTGGLAPADENPGSYAWLAVAEPQSRNGVVAGWLTHERASGVLFPKSAEGGVEVEARGDYGHLRLMPGESTETETLAIGCFDDARLGLEAWADAVARVYDVKLPPLPDGFCTWYTEKHGRASDEKNLADLTDFVAQELKPYGFSFVQIDDGWQLGDAKGNGPDKNFTDFNPQGPYPAGMKATADAIKNQGMTPGIWFMPFAGTHDDPWFAPHQDWFVKRADGTPYDTKWGGTSLDMTNPAVRDYLRDIVHHIADEWGYTYFKMDGLYTGLAAQQVYVNSGYKEDDFGDAVFADPSKTNTEAFRDGLKLVRETAGRHVFFLGCTVTQNMRSYGASLGLVDAMRIGPDNSGSWAKWVKTSPVFGARHYFLNGRVWYNDPDPEYLRATISRDEARAMASWPAIAGQLNSNSDWIPDLPTERVDILRCTIPSHGKTARLVDLFENDPPRLWTVTSDEGEKRRDVIGIFNFADEETVFNIPLDRLDLTKAEGYVAFDYWGNAFLPPFQDRLQTTLPPHSCQILAVRPIRDRPFLLSTTRHVTQGIIDVVSETWDRTEQTLVGTSQVVGGHPYELRLYAPQTNGEWRAAGGELSVGDSEAVAPIVVTQTGAEVRVTITSPESGNIHWKVRFAHHL